MPSKRAPLQAQARPQPYTRRCSDCGKYRDAELFDTPAALTCSLCVRRSERTAAGMLHRSQRQLDARHRQTESAADRYRRQLEAAGYTPSEVARYVRRRFPEHLNWNESPQGGS